MPNAYFLDTNVLLYVRDPREADKQKRARKWVDMLAERELAVISPQVMNEFAHSVLRKFPHLSFEELIESLEALRPWCLALPTGDTAIDAAVLHRRYQLSFYDSVLLATALAFGCDVFLSEDLGHGQHIEGLRIVNPFRTEPESFFATS